MKNFLVIFILELLFDFTLSKKYQYDVFSSKPGFFIFEWEILNNERILITLEVKASGWVGFGVSKYGFMKNSDIIIGYLDSKNNPVVDSVRVILNLN